MTTGESCGIKEHGWEKGLMDEPTNVSSDCPRAKFTHPQNKTNQNCL